MFFRNLRIIAKAKSKRSFAALRLYRCVRRVVDFCSGCAALSLLPPSEVTYGVALEAAKTKAREIGATDIVVLP